MHKVKDLEGEDILVYASGHNVITMIFKRRRQECHKQKEKKRGEEVRKSYRLRDRDVL